MQARMLGAAALGLALLGAPRPTAAAAPGAAAQTKIGAFVLSLADISEAQRKFEITFWVWLLSPDSGGNFDPAKSLEITNAATVDRQYAVTTTTPAGRWSQVKFRASVRAALDVRHFPFDRHTLVVNLEDAERDARSLEFVPDADEGNPPLSASVDLDPQDWSIGQLALTVENHVEPSDFGDPTASGSTAYSRAALHIDIARKHSLRILLTLLLGTFMSAIVAFFAVLLPIQQSPPRYTLLSSALFVCIANRLLVDARLPAGSSLGLVDQMQLVTIIGLLALTGASLALTNLAEKRITPARATQFSHRLGFGWIAAFVVIEVALVLWHWAGA